MSKHDIRFYMSVDNPVRSMVNSGGIEDEVLKKLGVKSYYDYVEFETEDGDIDYDLIKEAHFSTEIEKIMLDKSFELYKMIKEKKLVVYNIECSDEINGLERFLHNTIGNSFGFNGVIRVSNH